FRHRSVSRPSAAAASGARRNGSNTRVTTRHPPVVATWFGRYRPPRPAPDRRPVNDAVEVQTPMSLRLFRGHHRDAGTATETLAAAPSEASEETLVGLLPCSQAGCQRPAGPCSYIDRRFHGCDTAWCDEHGVTL